MIRIALPCTRGLPAHETTLRVRPATVFMIRQFKPQRPWRYAPGAPVGAPGNLHLGTSDTPDPPTYSSVRPAPRALLHGDQSISRFRRDAPSETDGPGLFFDQGVPSGFGGAGGPQNRSNAWRTFGGLSDNQRPAIRTIARNGRRRSTTLREYPTLSPARRRSPRSGQQCARSKTSARSQCRFAPSESA